MRIAVTGAGGFTGRYVVDALVAADAEYVPLDVELTDPDAVARAVAETEFDHLIHLAAHAFVAAQDWAAFYQVNQIGTLHLLNAVARVRPGARCVLASSAQVYGAGAQGLIAEDAPLLPANHYAISKLAMEMGAQQWRDRLDIVVTRPFNYTGVGQSGTYLIPKIVDHFRRAAPTIELGNTWVRREFNDVRSVARAYVRLALANEVPQVVNLATGGVRSIDEVLTILSRISNHSIEVQVNPAFVRANDVPVLGGDPARLLSVMPDWNSYTLDDTLEWMLGDRASR